MKVLHVITSLGIGGAENLLKESLPIMKEKGIGVDVLSLCHTESKFQDELKKKNIKIYTTNINKAYSPRLIFEIKKYLDRYDLIHAHLFQGQYWAAFAKMFSTINIPMVTTEHSTSNRRRRYKAFKLLDNLVYKKYDKIVCISEDGKQSLNDWLASTKEKSTVIYNGINLGRFENARSYKKDELIKNIQADKDVKLILMTGRLSMPKDHETLVRALGLLPDDYHLVLVGSGNLKDELKSLSKDLKIEERVHFLGFRSDVENIIKTCDVYVQSAHWEGFGIAAVEAMAGGLPVIASDVEGLSEVVEGGGLLFKKGDYKSLAGKIEKVTSEKSLYDELASKGKEKSKNYSLEKMVDKYIRLYNGLLSKD